MKVHLITIINVYFQNNILKYIIVKIVDLDQEFLNIINPVKKKFKTCDFFQYEINKITQSLAESLNVSNIYQALDLPDFRYVKDTKLEKGVIELTCKKLKLGEDIKYIQSQDIKYLYINKYKFQLVFFQSGFLPKLRKINSDLIFFMYQPGFRKVSFCGVYLFQNIDDNEEVKNFIATQINYDSVFIGFDKLVYDYNFRK